MASNGRNEVSLCKCMHHDDSDRKRHDAGFSLACCCRRVSLNLLLNLQLANRSPTKPPQHPPAWCMISSFTKACRSSCSLGIFSSSLRRKLFLQLQRQVMRLNTEEVS